MSRLLPSCKVVDNEYLSVLPNGFTASAAVNSGYGAESPCGDAAGGME